MKSKALAPHRADQAFTTPSPSVHAREMRDRSIELFGLGIHQVSYCKVIDRFAASRPRRFLPHAIRLRKAGYRYPPGSPILTFLNELLFFLYVESSF
jgi:hypothetical protein